MVTISKVTLTIHNIKIQGISTNLKEIYPKSEYMGSVLNYFETILSSTDTRRNTKRQKRWVGDGFEMKHLATSRETRNPPKKEVIAPLIIERIRNSYPRDEPLEDKFKKRTKHTFIISDSLEQTKTSIDRKVTDLMRRRLCPKQNKRTYEKEDICDGNLNVVFREDYFFCKFPTIDISNVVAVSETTFETKEDLETGQSQCLYGRSAIIEVGVRVTRQKQLIYIENRDYYINHMEPSVLEDKNDCINENPL